MGARQQDQPRSTGIELIKYRDGRCCPESNQWRKCFWCSWWSFLCKTFPSFRFDLTGKVIHVLPDEIVRNYTTLCSALPRESYSKEVDAAVLSVISFPAFAVADRNLINRTRNEIIKKLQGPYGCKRFLRDGHQTLLENTSRLHYDPHELKIFEGIECEWPLFFTYLVLDGYFLGNNDQAAMYMKKLEQILVPAPIDQAHAGAFSASHTFKLVPELYIVPKDGIEEEKKNPGSQPRYANENIPLVWAQSLFTLGSLIQEDLLSPAELDPLGRRFSIKNRNPSDIVVQVVLLAETPALQTKLATFGLETQTVEMCSPVTISPPSALRDAYKLLGQNKKLGLTGRPDRPIGTLSTCKLYRCQGRLYAFLPHFMDIEEFYLVSDNDYLVSAFEESLSFIQNHWEGTGRPTLVIMLTNEMMGRTFSKYKQNPVTTGIIGSPRIDEEFKMTPTVNPPDIRNKYPKTFQNKKNMLNLMMSLRSGVCGGVRVRLGRLTDLISTACIESLDFLATYSDIALTKSYWHHLLKGTLQSADRKLLDNTEAAIHQPTPTRLRSLKRRSFVEIDPNRSASKSPLTSPIYTDDPFDLYQEPEKVPESPLKKEVSTLAPLSRLVKSARSLMAEDCVDPSPVPSLPPARRSTDSEESAAGLLNLTLGDTSFIKDSIEMLATSTNLYDQVDLLHYIFSCHGLDYTIKDLGTVRALLEEVYIKAIHLCQWNIVRQAAGLLKKVVNSLTINVTDLLIRQKPVTVGLGDNEFFFMTPRSPKSLADIIFNHWYAFSGFIF